MFPRSLKYLCSVRFGLCVVIQRLRLPQQVRQRRSATPGHTAAHGRQHSTPGVASRRLSGDGQRRGAPLWKSRVLRLLGSIYREVVRAYSVLSKHFLSRLFALHRLVEYKRHSETRYVCASTFPCFYVIFGNTINSRVKKRISQLDPGRFVRIGLPKLVESELGSKNC